MDQIKIKGTNFTLTAEELLLLVAKAQYNLEKDASQASWGVINKVEKQFGDSVAVFSKIKKMGWI